MKLSKRNLPINVLVLTALAITPSLADGYDADTPDEVVVKGKTLYSDQVNALKTPTPIVNVPQSASILTGDESLTAGSNQLVTSAAIRRVSTHHKARGIGTLSFFVA